MQVEQLKEEICEYQRSERPEPPAPEGLGVASLQLPKPVLHLKQLNLLLAASCLTCFLPIIPCVDPITPNSHLNKAMLDVRLQTSRECEKNLGFSSLD
ncbi:hypothetical protein EK904_000944 [Melospiza melodia maxima]|nr:hypothetical protein EK904_000944 [Melospiza melodia maxima]